MPAEWGNWEFKLNAIIDKLPVIKHKEQSNIINQIEKNLSVEWDWNCQTWFHDKIYFTGPQIKGVV